MVVMQVEACQMGVWGLAWGDIYFDFGGRVLIVEDGAPQHLTPLESRLLEVLMFNPDRILTRKFLMQKVWETDFVDDTRTLEVHISWLRQKLGESGDEPRHIQTIRGVGYYFDPH